VPQPSDFDPSGPDQAAPIDRPALYMADGALLFDLDASSRANPTALTPHGFCMQAKFPWVTPLCIVGAPGQTADLVQVNGQTIIAADGTVPGGTGGPYTHVQPIAATQWGPITHNLGRTAVVVVVDQNGDEQMPQVVETDPNTATLYFNVPVLGTARFL
jgi:hypothetical protein